MKTTRSHLAALVGVLGLLTLTGCGGGGTGSASAGGENAASSAVQDRAAATAPGVQGAPGAQRLSSSGGGDGSAVLVQPSVIRTGDLAIRTADPQEARARVDAVLSRLHGTVDDEQTVYDKQGEIRDSHLVLRVPVDSFATAMDDLEHLGTVVHSSSTGKDVTSEVIDVQQRLRTLKISLHDLNSFQRHAATIDQLLRFENAITQRRGEYQSLKAQRDQLVGQVSMSTIDLDVSVPPTHAAATRSLDHAGFVTGLRHGWSALTGTVVVALTAVGAVLPFAVLIGLVGLPVWWWARRTWRARPAAPAAD